MNISLYILNYNYSTYLEQAIESALAQTFDDYEILIIDDGSTDNSRDIIARYEHISHVRTFYKENSGLIASANFALEQSSADYIMRLDADDFLDPHALEILYSYIIQDRHIGYVFPGYFIVDKQGEKITKVNRGERPFDLNIDDEQSNGACCLIDRCKLLSEGGYTKEISCRDGLDLFLKFRDKYRILSIPEYLFYYRKHGENLTEDSARIVETERTLQKLALFSGKADITAK